MSSFLKNIFGKGAASASQAVAKSSSKHVNNGKTRSRAKERLSIILASQRGSDILEGLDHETLQREVMEVVQRHLNEARRATSAKTPNFNMRQDGDINLFEMQVELVPRR